MHSGGLCQDEQKETLLEKQEPFPNVLSQGMCGLWATHTHGLHNGAKGSIRNRETWRQNRGSLKTTSRHPRPSLFARQTASKP